MKALKGDLLLVLGKYSGLSSVIDKELSDIKDSTVQSIVGRHSDAI